MIERIEQFIRNQGLSVRAFEKTINASDGMIRRAINNNTDIQSKWITLIAEKYPHMNIEWLVTGKGSMLKDESKIADLISYDPSVGVPYYDVDFTAGFDAIFNNQTLLPAHNIVFKPLRKRNYGVM